MNEVAELRRQIANLETQVGRLRAPMPAQERDEISAAMMRAELGGREIRHHGEPTTSRRNGFPIPAPAARQLCKAQPAVQGRACRDG